MKNIPYKIYLLNVAILFSVLILGWFSISKVMDYHITTIKQDMELDAKQIFNAMQSNINENINALKHTELIFHSSKNVSREEFHRYAQGVLKLYPEIQALEWLPVISHQNREKYEKTVRDEGFPNYFIKQKHPEKGMIAAAKRDFYYPIHYLEPYSGNEAAFGLDSASNSEARATIEKAIATGKVSMSAPTTLVQGDGEQQAVLIYKPHYSSSNELLGFVELIIKMDDFFLKVQQQFPLRKSLSCRLNDSTNEKRFIAGARADFNQGKGWFTISIPWEIAGRDWLFEVNHDVTIDSEYQFGKFWSRVIVILGFAINILLSYLVYSKLMQSRHAKAFQNEEERYQKLLNMSADAYFLQDMDGNLLDINQIAAEVMGYTREELLSMNVRDLNVLIEGTTFDDYLKYFRNFPKRKTVHKELIYRKKDGTHFPVEVSMNKFTYNNEDVLSGFIREISERKKYEESLKQATKAAKDANQAKSDFLAKMSHEFRTPMHSILSFSDIGLKRLQNVPVQKLENYFVNIQNSGKRLMGLLNDLLDLAKLETGEMKFCFDKATLNSILESCIDEQKNQIKQKNIQLEMKTTENQLDVVCDVEKMRQVITNLLANAIKFTAEGSTITIGIGENDDILAVAGVKFCICDEGDGIPETELEDVFNKFVQSNKNSASREGTGLGLAICSEIIEGHYGKIWAENVDVGASLVFVIPLIPLQSYTG